MLYSPFHHPPVPSGQRHQSVSGRTEMGKVVMYHKHTEVFPRRITMLVVMEIPSCAHLDIFEPIFMCFLTLACFLYTGFSHLPRRCTRAFPSPTENVLQWLLQPFPSMATTRCSAQAGQWFCDHQVTVGASWHHLRPRQPQASVKPCPGTPMQCCGFLVIKTDIILVGSPQKGGNWSAPRLI